MFLTYLISLLLIQELLNSKLPPVPEEDDMFRNSSINANYSDLDLITSINQINEIGEDPTTIKNEQQLPQEEQEASMQNLQYTAKIYTQPQPEAANLYRNSM